MKNLFKLVLVVAVLISCLSCNKAYNRCYVEDGKGRNTPVKVINRTHLKGIKKEVIRSGFEFLTHYRCNYPITFIPTEFYIFEKNYYIYVDIITEIIKSNSNLGYVDRRRIDNFIDSINKDDKYLLLFKGYENNGTGSEIIVGYVKTESENVYRHAY